MTGQDALDPQEQEAYDLLCANDPRAAATLAALSDAGRARVLTHLSTSTAGSRGTNEADASEQYSAPESANVPFASAVTDDGEQEAEPETSDDIKLTEADPEWLGIASATSTGSPGSSLVSGGGLVASLLARLDMSSRRGKVILTVVGVVVILLLVSLIRSCGSGESDSADDLLLTRSSDLFVGRTNVEIDRDDRIVRDYSNIVPTRVVRDGDWWQVPVASQSGRRLLLATTQDGTEAWVIDGSDQERFSRSNDSMTSLLIGDSLYIHESREGTQACYRGSIKSADDLERLSRGDYCSIAYSGHTLQVDESSGSYRATVFSPEGTETQLRRNDFNSLPVLSQNGLVLVSRDNEGVVAVDVETGDRVYDNEGGVDFDMISHPSGRTALAVTISSGEVFLVIVDDQGFDDITEIETGQLSAVFSPSGDLFWTERADNGDTILYVWDASGNDDVEFPEEENLIILDVYEDSVVTVTSDDLGTYFQRFSVSSTDGTELHKFDDTPRGAAVVGDHLWIAGSEIASVVPLDGGDPADSNTWDGIEVFDVNNDGVLVAAGVDGSSEVLFSIRPGSNRDVEYGEYDNVVSAQIYGNVLYATVRDGSGVETLTFDVSSGEPRDNAVDYEGYQLINNRVQRYRDTINVSASYVEFTPTTTEPPPMVEPPMDDPVAEPAPAPEPEPEPEPEPGPFIRIVPGGASYRGTVGASDQDEYVLEISGDGTPMIAETYGSTDVVMELYDSRDVSIAYNDDGGEGSNARIETTLDRGTYYLVVRGYDGRSGDYELYVVY